VFGGALEQRATCFGVKTLGRPALVVYGNGSIPYYSLVGGIVQCLLGILLLSEKSKI
jgi:hypothetical protein